MHSDWTNPMEARKIVKTIIKTHPVLWPSDMTDEDMTRISNRVGKLRTAQTLSSSLNDTDFDGDLDLEALKDPDENVVARYKVTIPVILPSHVKVTP